MTVATALLSIGLSLATAPPANGTTEADWRQALRTAPPEAAFQGIGALEAARTGAPILMDLVRCSATAAGCDVSLPLEVRVAAAIALGRIEPLAAMGPGAAAASLLDVLSTAAREPGVDGAAVFALGQLGSAALAAGQPALAARVEVRLLGLLSPVETDTPARPVPILPLWRALGRVGGEATLTRALGAVSELGRPVALVTAGLVLTRLARDPAGEPALIEALDDPNPEVRAAALYAFARAGKAPFPAPVVARVLTALEGGPGSERTLAARAFRKAGLSGGFESALPRLQALFDGERLQAHEAAVVMSGLGAAAPSFRANVIRHVASSPSGGEGRLFTPWIHVALAAAHDLPEGSALAGELDVDAPSLARRTPISAFGEPIARRRSLLVCALATDDQLLDHHCSPAARVERAAALGRTTALWLASPSPGARMAALTASQDAAALEAALSDPDGPVVATACSRASELTSVPQSLTDAVVARAVMLASAATTDANSLEPALDCFKASQLLAKGVPDALATAARSSAPALARLASSVSGVLPGTELPLPAFPTSVLPPSATALAVVTDAGSFRIALDADSAPATVRHLTNLAAARRFDGLSVHRVVADFVIQTGDPRGDGWGGLSPSIPCENNDLPYVSGSAGMALAGKDTGTSQWFVTHTAHPHLHGTYTQFGRVVTGLETVDRIVPGDRILSVTVEP